MEYTYGLGTLDAADKQTQGTDWVMKSVLECSEQEYEQCVEDCLALDTYRTDAQLFQVVLWNEQDFRELMDTYSTAYVERNFAGLPHRSPDLNLNRCLLNLLSANRSYLDYVEIKVKRKYGAQSVNALKFKKYCADAYDGSFSYRFLYRFRNYAQHCGLPLTKITFDAKTVESESERVDRSLNVGVDRSDLLEAGFNWGALCNEIADQPEVINIPDHVGQMMDRLKEIHTNYITDEFVTLRPHAARLRGLIQKISTDVQELHLFKLSIDPSDPRAKVDCRMQVVPTDLVEDVFDERFAILFEEEPNLKHVRLLA